MHHLAPYSCDHAVCNSVSLHIMLVTFLVPFQILHCYYSNGCVMFQLGMAQLYLPISLWSGISIACTPSPHPSINNMVRLLWAERAFLGGMFGLGQESVHLSGL